jgi:glycosyltransferase involved in cell wall biosynthesis
MKETQGHVTHLIVGLDAGGAELALLHLANAQQDMGWKVSVIFLKPQATALQPTFQSHGIDTLHIATLPKITDHLKRIKTGDTPFILHTHLFYADALGWILRGLVSVPWITTLHSTYDFHTRNASRRVLSQQFYPRADKIIAVSQEVGQSFQDQGALTQFDTIPNPVADAFFGSTSKSHPTPTHKNLLMIGRLAPEKRFDLGIHALAHLPDSYRLTIAGTGPLLEALQKQAQEMKLENRISFCGFQSDTLPLYHQADLVLLPSTHEGLPLVSLEAIVTDTPVLANAVGGLVALLETSPIPTRHINSAKTLAHEIEALFKQPERLKTWGAWCQTHKSGYAAKSIATKYIQQYQVVLSSR